MYRGSAGEYKADEQELSRGSAGEYQADSRQVSRGSFSEYQADEQAGVARLRSQVAGRWAGRLNISG